MTLFYKIILTVVVIMIMVILWIPFKKKPKKHTNRFEVMDHGNITTNVDLVVYSHSSIKSVNITFKNGSTAKISLKNADFSKSIMMSMSGFGEYTNLPIE